MCINRYLRDTSSGDGQFQAPISLKELIHRPNTKLMLCENVSNHRATTTVADRLKCLQVMGGKEAAGRKKVDEGDGGVSASKREGTWI